MKTQIHKKAFCKKKEEKKEKKWRQACVSNPNVLLFIQTRGNHWLVQNAPKPFA